jgi:hypothetical protein
MILPEGSFSVEDANLAQHGSDVGQQRNGRIKRNAEGACC